MDFLLGATTLFVNANLGWSKGASYAWLLWTANATGWLIWAWDIEKLGIVTLSVVTMYMGLANAMRRYYQDHNMTDRAPWNTWHFRLKVWLRSKLGRRMHRGCRGYCDGHWGPRSPGYRMGPG